MNHIKYIDQTLHIEQVKASSIAASIATPFYCYSSAVIKDNYNSFVKEATLVNPLICFAVKSNSNMAILKTLAALGSGADCVSEGEIRRAIMAGIAPQKIVFSGVGKTSEEISYAIDHNILQFNVESEEELDLLSQIAKSKNYVARIAIRINPDVDAGTHEKITTGRKDNKFGINFHNARSLYDKASKLAAIDVVGISIHIGSQIMELEPFAKAFDKLNQLLRMLKEDGHNIRILDIGGGLGVNYHSSDKQILIKDYFALVHDKFRRSNCQIIIEPGRRLVAGSGVLITKILYNKQSDDHKFIIVDAGMNDLVRPSFYDAYHQIIPLEIKPNNEHMIADVVGPVCESSDIFAKLRQLPMVMAGELLAIKDVGAYGAVMASSYNTRLAAPEILVNGDQFAVIRARPSYEDVLKQDIIPDWL
jgi:diaminopimelate decarboxylase